MNYSILIVDDDRILVDKLKETVNWQSIGIQTVFTAYNIRQAKNLIEQCEIDLMLCDIDMPQGSGLELLEWIRDNGHSTVCIFLSSYANFSYAQKALRLGSADYLLKPIFSADLESAVRKTIRETLLDTRETESGADPTDDFWMALLKAGDKETLIQKAAAEHRLPEKQRVRFCMVRILEEIPDADDRNRIPMDQMLITEAFTEVFGGERLLAIQYLDSFSWILVLEAGKDPADAQDLKAGIERLSEKIHEYPYLLAGHVCSPTEAAASYEALMEMRRTAVPGPSRVALAGKGPVPNVDVSSFPWKRWRKALAGHSQDLEAEIRQAVSTRQWNRSSIAGFVLELEYMLNDYLHFFALSNEALFDREALRIRAHAARRTVDGCLRFISWSLEMIEGHRKVATNTTEILKAYIQEHLDEDLSRKQLAQQVYLSEDYMSRLFMQDTGTTLVNYIACCRIEKACEYLKDTNLPVGRIALSVGFHNFSYFSKTFRDQTGQTPNEYREEQKRKA